MREFDRFFEIVGDIRGAETIAEGRGIRMINHLIASHGGKNWRKRKGIALVREKLTGETFRAEVHWYEAHGVGKVMLKLKKELP